MHSFEHGPAIFRFDAGFGQQRPQQLQSHLHGPGCPQHVRNKIFANLKFFLHNIHAGNEPLGQMGSALL